MGISKAKWLAAAVACLAAVGGPAMAAGFYAQEQSVEGLGRAYSGEAASTGADALWWNPAAIGDIDGRTYYSGNHLVAADIDIDDAGSTIRRPSSATAPVGGAARSEPFDISVVPNTAAAMRLNDQFSLGVAITAPFGFGAVSRPDAFTRYEAVKVRLIDLDFQPTLAWRPVPWLRLGAGADAEIADTKFSVALPNLSPLDADGRANLAANGWNFGWVAGAQLAPTAALTLGASYRAAIAHTLGGHVTSVGLLGSLATDNGQSVTNVRFSTPWLATLAARWRVAERLTLEAQAQRIGWSDYGGFAISTVGATPPAPGVRQRDTTSIAVGFDYAANAALTLRAGIQDDPRAIRDSTVLPDGDRLIFAAGASWRKSPRTTFDLGAAYVSFRHTAIGSQFSAFAGTSNATPVSLAGELSSHAVVLSFAVRGAF
ncbi:MAG TPA: outer membrane protein transport protein [Caulobacteraceae bacterium]